MYKKKTISNNVHAIVKNETILLFKKYMLPYVRTALLSHIPKLAFLDFFSSQQIRSCRIALSVLQNALHGVRFRIFILQTFIEKFNNMVTLDLRLQNEKKKL